MTIAAIPSTRSVHFAAKNAQILARSRQAHAAIREGKALTTVAAELGVAPSNLYSAAGAAGMVEVAEVPEGWVSVYRAERSTGVSRARIYAAACWGRVGMAVCDGRRIVEVDEVARALGGRA